MQTSARLPHYVNIFFGDGAQRTKSFSVQQGDWNSREVVCSLYAKYADGRNALMSQDGITVNVVYDKDNGAPSSEYATEKIGEGKVKFIIPKNVLTTYGDAELQLRLYGEDCLLHSAILPFQIKKSIAPSTSQTEEDVEPAIIVLFQQVEETLKKAEEAEAAREEAEKIREEKFAEFEEIISNLQTSEKQVYNASTRYAFPSVGSPDVIYKAEKECKLYQWNSEEYRYEELGSTAVVDITIIHGGNAYGTD